MLEIPRNVVSVILVPPRLWQRKWLCKIVWYMFGLRCSTSATGKTPMAAFDLGVQEVHRCIASWEPPLGDNLVDADIYREDDDDDADPDDDDDAEDSEAASRSGSRQKEDSPTGEAAGQESEEERIHRLLHPSWPLPNLHAGPPASLN
jgi:hypothetical protein